MAKKGAAGTGSHYQRPDGHWEAARMVNRKRYTASGKTQAEARRKLKAKIEATPELPTNTLQSFLADWLRHSAKGRVSASTFERYEQVVRRHLVPGLGAIQVADLRPVHVERFLAGLTVSQRTRWHVRAILRTALSYAVKSELTPLNAAALADPPKVARSVVEPLTMEQARLLLVTSESDPLHALYVMALYTGMRQGELLGLRWSDLDLEAGTVNIRRGIRRVGGKVREIPTKTDRSRRMIALVPAVVDALVKHEIRQRDMDRPLAGDRWKHQGHVFPTSLGTPMEGSLFNARRWKPLRERAGLPPTLKFHHLRHSTASLLLNAGVPMQVVSEILGHTSITLTVNTYGHTSLDAQREALAGLSL